MAEKLSDADVFAQAVQDALEANRLRKSMNEAVLAGRVMDDGTPVCEATIDDLMAMHADAIAAAYGGDDDGATD